MPLCGGRRESKLRVSERTRWVIYRSSNPDAASSRAVVGRVRRWYLYRIRLYVDAYWTAFAISSPRVACSVFAECCRGAERGMLGCDGSRSSCARFFPGFNVQFASSRRSISNLDGIESVHANLLAATVLRLYLGRTTATGYMSRSWAGQRKKIGFSDAIIKEVSPSVNESRRNFFVASWWVPRA